MGLKVDFSVARQRDRIVNSGGASLDSIRSAVNSGGIICAFDPGRANGFAMKLAGIYHTATFTQPEDVWDALKKKPVAVAVEAFHTGGRVDEHMIHTIEMVGSIRGVCWALGIPCFGQMPQARISFVPDAIQALAKQGRVVKMTKAEDDHEVSALAHLLRLEDRIKTGAL